jgi:hypothetical protein
VWTLTLIFWTLIVFPGWRGSGYGTNYFEAFMNSDCLGEHAYSHQNLFRLIAQISQPSAWLPKTPSISIYDLVWPISLLPSQQPYLSLY